MRQSNSHTEVDVYKRQADKSGQTLEINEKVSSREEARQLAMKRLREKNKGEFKASFKLAGDARLVAGVTVQVAGYGAFDGKYIIETAAHSISPVSYTHLTNKETIVSAEKKWDNAQSDPLADIEWWHEIVQREGFVNCNVCVMAKDVATAFINHAKVKEVLDVKAYDLAVIKPRQLPNGATYILSLIHISLSLPGKIRLPPIARFPW